MSAGRSAASVPRPPRGADSCCSCCSAGAKRRPPCVGGRPQEQARASVSHAAAAACAWHEQLLLIGCQQLVRGTHSSLCNSTTGSLPEHLWNSRYSGYCEGIDSSCDFYFIDFFAR